MDERKRVLVVDDDPASRAMICAMLEERFDVIPAADAVEAFATLEHERVDAVVSDFLMPGVDGLEFLNTVRQRYPGISGVLVTGQSHYPEVQAALRSSRFTILFKPIEAEKLQCWVTNATTITKIKRDTDRLKAGVAARRADAQASSETS